MLHLILPEKELCIQRGSEVEVIQTEKLELKMEHSLISLTKWEEIHKKPFLRDDGKTDDEIFDYFRCMVISPNVSPDWTDRLGAKEQRRIIDYINDPMTATTFGKRDNVSKKNKRKAPNGKIFTAELIYYYMIAYNIPVQFEKWHLNKLLTLIMVCEEENNAQANGGKSSMSKREILSRNARLNAERKAKWNTKG